MNFDIVKKYIDNWDPVDLLIHAPNDEYEDECKKIALYHGKNNRELGMIIYDVFIESFGKSIFNKNLFECEKIAKVILKANNENF